MTHWWFDFTNKCHWNYFIYASDLSYGLDWIGLDWENWTHVQLCLAHNRLL